MTRRSVTTVLRVSARSNQSAWKLGERLRRAGQRRRADRSAAPPRRGWRTHQSPSTTGHADEARGRRSTATAGIGPRSAKRGAERRRARRRQVRCPRSRGSGSRVILIIDWLASSTCFGRVDLDLHAAVLGVVERVVRIGRAVPAHAVHGELVGVQLLNFLTRASFTALARFVGQFLDQRFGGPAPSSSCRCGPR